MRLHSDTMHILAFHYFRDLTPFHTVFICPICILVPHPIVSCIHQPTFFVHICGPCYLYIIISYPIRINTFLKGLSVMIRIGFLQNV